MVENPVRTTITNHIETHGLSTVTIDDAALEDLATDIADSDLPTPTWPTPPFPDPDRFGAETAANAILIANSLNFQFDHYHTNDTYATTYDGESYTGAFALFAAVTRALDDDIPVTDPQYLATLSRSTVADLFAGDPPIPMLPDRHRILRHIGDRLTRHDASTLIAALPTTGPYRPFADGDGLVEWLVRELPAAYNDRRTLAGRSLVFHKKAQLGAALLAGTLGPDHQHGAQDLGSLTLFADYVIPAVLRDVGVLNYSQEVGERIDDRNVLPVGSRAEIEIRAATVAAGDRLLTAVNDRRPDPITAVILDHYLWRRGRNRSLTFHRTPTTSY